MDQCREPRFAVNQRVAVTVPRRPQRETVRVMNASGCGLAIRILAPVAPGTAVKIEIEDCLVLVEAVYCRPKPDGHLVGIELDQVSCSLTELGRRLQGVCQSATRPAGGSRTTGAAALIASGLPRQRGRFYFALTQPRHSLRGSLRASLDTPCTLSLKSGH